MPGGCILAFHSIRRSSTRLYSILDVDQMFAYEEVDTLQYIPDSIVACSRTWLVSMPSKQTYIWTSI